jgi:hypothetical protein
MESVLPHGCQAEHTPNGLCSLHLMLETGKFSGQDSENETTRLDLEGLSGIWEGIQSGYVWRGFASW